MTISSAEAAEELLRRALAKKSLYEFLKAAWHVVEPGYDFVDEWPTQAICEHLEAVVRGDIRLLLINQPPRTLKSISTAVMLPVWTWLHHPTLKFIYGSYTYGLAEDASIKCRALIRSRWFQARWGDTVSISPERDTKEYFAITAGGERIITSVDGTLTGRGADVLVADDPNNPRDTSDTMLKSTQQWWTQVVPTRLNDLRTGRMIVVQQRVHEKDVSGLILEHSRKDWVHLRLPMEFEPKARCVTVALPSTGGKLWRDPRTDDGELLLPKRVPREELDKLKRSLVSQYVIAGQLQQRPSPESGGIIKRGWFKLWKSSERPRLTYTVLSLDTAVSEAKGSSHSAATCWGVFKDEHGVPNVVLLSMWRERCEYPELRERVKRMATDYLDDGKTALPSRSKKRRPDLVLLEAKGPSGQALAQDLMRGGVMVSRFNPDKLGDKTHRVRLVTPLLENGRVWVPAMPPTFDRPRLFADMFVEQAASFPQAASRDLVDTMTQALWRLISSGFLWSTEDRGVDEDMPTKPAELEEALY